MAQTTKRSSMDVRFPTLLAASKDCADAKKGSAPVTSTSKPASGDSTPRDINPEQRLQRIFGPAGLPGAPTMRWKDQGLGDPPAHDPAPRNGNPEDHRGTAGFPGGVAPAWVAPEWVAPPWGDLCMQEHLSTQDWWRSCMELLFPEGVSFSNE
eukprot:TRINITY_DN15934_c0_g1_i1.p1 TRINITY_DN15934_c0_g1~~TRINITY_DN15934_c0_g1_i1.p1  ORF type:complete len:164 (+),score=24.93 TRINITY_DN15934_c0_g1_i1:36-494(+)